MAGACFSRNGSFSVPRNTHSGQFQAEWQQGAALMPRGLAAGSEAPSSGGPVTWLVVGRGE